MSQISHYLLLDRIKVEKANAISSPLTYGFPAISGIMGAVHALNRKIVEAGFPVDLSGVLIACHAIHVHSYRPHRYADYSFNQSRNPIKKDGSTAAIIEEGKADLTLSLVIEVSASRSVARDIDDNQEKLEKQCKEWVLQQRMVGGSVHAVKQVRLLDGSEEKEIIKQLLPGFVLMQATQELLEITRELQQAKPEATALDALIEVSTLHHEPVETKVNKNGWQTRSVKTGKGWLVPIPVGFQSIAPQFAPGELANCRTNQYPSQYVESIYSLGKWVFPYRLPKQFSNSFWRYKQSNNLFLFSQSIQNQQGE